MIGCDASLVLSRRELIASAAAALAISSPPAHATVAPTMLISHPAFAGHDPGPLSAERPARMRAIDQALSDPRFAALVRREAPLRDDAEEAILRAHDRQHLERVRAAALDKAHLPFSFDGDTVVAAGTWEAAMRAVSAGLMGVDAVMDSSSGIKAVFCQVRPPGHHAEAQRTMGFCLFSNVAISGLYARVRHGAERIAVVDFDVHHGNGTQRIFWSDRSLFYGSTHEMPLFPGTGALNETGVGNIFNAPLKAGDGGIAFRSAMKERILPALDAFRPDLILISAGFDAHDGDPLAHLRLFEADFAWVTAELMSLAARHCRGRIVSMLEGGYELDALGRSTAAHVATLMGA
ncbi:histone deacetylase family protein [Hyphomicrobium sp.]|uniref:histone deacetylase family protein n=1 Tax=Hyphomicrobium sp. TaxID=82 RepID=UPI002FE091F6